MADKIYVTLLSMFIVLGTMVTLINEMVPAKAGAYSSLDRQQMTWLVNRTRH